MYYLGFEASNTSQLIEAPVASQAGGTLASQAGGPLASQAGAPIASQVAGASQAGRFNSKVLLAHILNKVYQQTDIKIKVIRSSNIFSS